MLLLQVMENPIPAIFNWSGGKDSMLALHQVLSDKQYDVRHLLTTVNERYNRVSMHGVRQSLLVKQAESLGIPLHQVSLPDSPEMGDYERLMEMHMAKLKIEGMTHSIFGDIFLEDLRVYRERKLSGMGFSAVFPLWKRDTKEILREFIGLGYRTLVVCTQENLGEFCGRVIDEVFIKDLPAGIDTCGENGEFHTFVFDGPLFSCPVEFSLGEKIFRTFPSPSGSNAPELGYWYLDLID